MRGGNEKHMYRHEHCHLVYKIRGNLNAMDKRMRKLFSTQSIEYNSTIKGIAMENASGLRDSKDSNNRKYLLSIILMHKIYTSVCINVYTYEHETEIFKHK